VHDWVGSTRIGDLKIRVHPKIPITRLLFLLGYSRDPRFRPTTWWPAKPTASGPRWPTP